MKFSKDILKLKSNPMSHLAAKASVIEDQGNRVVHFEIGEPDFTTPEHIVEAAIDSLKQGETHYGGTFGMNELRDIIAAKTNEDLGWLPEREQVLVSTGLALIYFFLRTVINKGDEIIVPDPGFTPYFSMFDFIGATPVVVPLREEEGFKLNPKRVAEQISDRTKVIIINSPQNPTGAVMTKKEVDDLGELALERNIYLLSDEVYSKMTYDAKHFSPAHLDKCQKNIVVVNSFSKAYAMTGWRVGYMLAPAELVTKMGLLVGNTTFSVPDFIQRGAIAALTGTQEPLRKMLTEYNQRRMTILDGLNSLPGVTCVEPGGAFYVFPNIKDTGFSSDEFAKKLLEEAHVALLPGTIFGKAGEGYARLAYSVSVEEIKKGIERMRRWLENNMND
jgi:aspartate aminotransferase